MSPREIEWKVDDKFSYSSGSYGRVNGITLFKTFWDACASDVGDRWKLEIKLPLTLKRKSFKTEEGAKEFADKVLLYFWTKITSD